MPNFFGSSEEEKQRRTLSQSARDAIAELQKRIQSTLDSDLTREPKLEPAEKARMAELEKEIAVIEPKMKDLENQLTAGDARLKDLKQNGLSFQSFLNGDDFDKAIDEIAHLERILPVKANTLTYGLTTMERNKNEIRTIKQKAREREVENERR